MYGSQSLSDGYSMCDWCGVRTVIVSRCLAEGRVSGDESAGKDCKRTGLLVHFLLPLLVYSGDIGMVG